MKIRVSISQRGYRNGEIEVEVGDQATVEDATQAAYIMAEDVSFRDHTIIWGPWQHAFREHPEPDDIVLITPLYLCDVEGCAGVDRGPWKSLAELELHKRQSHSEIL